MADPVWTEILTLSEVKTHLRVGSDTSEDTLITTYITAAREYVEGYQNRVFLSSDEEVETETMTGI
ncbi:MAG: phage gp6-like head-tail connector protein, partial [Clostridia bacterium]|nr:phage gp6-like head-tail connector protein [Clostridia bacterium]